MTDGLDLSGLRAHVRAMHPRMPMRRANADLAREHAREHHRLACSHTHGPVASADNTGPLVGPGSKLRRPAGWYTGRDAVPVTRR
jgi:hypothetical protein